MKASVAGTPQAGRRSSRTRSRRRRGQAPEAKLTPPIRRRAEVKAIEGTRLLRRQLADADDRWSSRRYYAVQNGVWFVRRRQPAPGSSRRCRRRSTPSRRARRSTTSPTSRSTTATAEVVSRLHARLLRHRRRPTASWSTAPATPTRRGSDPGTARRSPTVTAAAIAYTPWTGWAWVRLRLGWGGARSARLVRGPTRGGGRALLRTTARPRPLRRRARPGARAAGPARPATSTGSGARRPRSRAVGRLQRLDRQRLARPGGVVLQLAHRHAAAGQRGAVGNVYTGEYATGAAARR